MQDDSSLHKLPQIIVQAFARNNFGSGIWLKVWVGAESSILLQVEGYVNYNLSCPPVAPEHFNYELYGAASALEYVNYDLYGPAAATEYVNSQLYGPAAATEHVNSQLYGPAAAPEYVNLDFMAQLPHRVCKFSSSGVGF